MRVLKFPAYEWQEKREVPVPARAWIILFRAIRDYPCGNKEQTATVAGATAAIKDASQLIPPPEDRPSEGETRRLKAEGAEVYVEDAEWRSLEKAVEKYREQLTGSDSDALLFVDVLLDRAPTISKKQVSSLGASRSHVALQKEG